MNSKYEYIQTKRAIYIIGSDLFIRYRITFMLTTDVYCTLHKRTNRCVSIPLSLWVVVWVITKRFVCVSIRSLMVSRHNKSRNLLHGVHLLMCEWITKNKNEAKIERTFVIYLYIKEYFFTITFPVRMLYPKHNFCSWRFRIASLTFTVNSFGATSSVINSFSEGEVPIFWAWKHQKMEKVGSFIYCLFFFNLPNVIFNVKFFSNVDPKV